MSTDLYEICGIKKEPRDKTIAKNRRGQVIFIRTNKGNTKGMVLNHIQFYFVYWIWRLQDKKKTFEEIIQDIFS